MTQEVITIDGFAYVGKSQIAKALSKLTGFAYINTGHMYRALAKLALESGVRADDENSLLEILKKTPIKFSPLEGEWRTIVNGKDWTNVLDDSEVVLFSSKIAAIPAIRQILTEIQRGYAEKRAIIMEGRDIGSVVFPNAKWKFFITASIEVRAKRMYKILPDSEKRKIENYTILIPKVKEIDEADKNRKVAPLIEAPDAFIYDNSESPSAERDALVLKHYLDRYDQYAREGRIKFDYEEVMTQSGKYIRA